MDQVIVYTDGACRPNPGRGGWAAIILHNGERTELSGGFRSTTSARAELWGVIQALESMPKPSHVTIYTDSVYIANAITHGWLRKWSKNGWRTYDGDPVKNRDLWRRILKQAEIHQVETIWVRGHNGVAENEAADTLSSEATGRPDLPIDDGYEGAKN